MSQNPTKQKGFIVEDGFPLWSSQTASTRNRLLEFRAGKMFVLENMVHPDPRKGLVYIYQDDDGVMHFCWMDRSRKVVEVDLITMPTDCSYKRIEKCTTGRVFQLKIRSSSTKLFFWMQEPSTANDLHICNRVNSLLNYPPPRMMLPDQVFNSPATLQFLLSQLNSEQLHFVYDGNDVEVVWEEPRNQPAAVEGTSEPPAPPPATPPTPDPFVNLGEVINEESVKSISINPALMKRLENMLPPIGGDQKESLSNTVKSIQFKQAIEDFSMALKQGTSGQILRDLNVNSAAVAAAERGNVDSFIKALQQGAGAAATTAPKLGGPPPGPGNSGSSGRKTKDPNHANNRKGGEGGRKGSTQQEDPKSNSKQTNGGSRKRNYDSISKVNSAQQTEPIRITSMIQSEGPEVKIARKLQQLSFYSDSDRCLSLEKCQNTDPVRIEEYVSSKARNNYNDEQLASGSSAISGPSGLIKRNVPQIQKEPTEYKDGLKSEELAIPAPVFEVDNPPSSQKRDGKSIVLTNDYQMEKNANSRKRAHADKDEDAGMKRIKFEGKNAQPEPKERSTQDVQKGNEREIFKVEGEQQTEPVRIKSAHSTGAETKITTKRTSTRGPRIEGSMERGQNTEPVRIEEKQKRQSKHKDPKNPPENNK